MKIGPCDHDDRDAMPARRMTETLPSIIGAIFAT